MQKAEEKAVACYQSGNFAAALRSFLNVLAEDPKREDILVYIANCYDGLGQKEEAVAYYRKALKANKKSDIAAANLAIIFYELQDYAEAQNAAERALKINPRNASALSVMGNLRYRKKDFDGALKFYQQAMETKRDFYTAVLNAASIYFERRDFNTAYFYAKRTVQSYPDSLEAQNLLAGVCIELGRSDEAILILSELYEKNPEDCWLCNLLSQAFQQKKEYDRALEMGWRAVVLSKGDNDQQINFGYLLYEIAVESPATDVLSHARRWQREYPDNPIVRHMTGAMLNAGHVSQINSVYVRDIFNAFADDFENVLGSLDYAAEPDGGGVGSAGAKRQAQENEDSGRRLRHRPVRSLFEKICEIPRPGRRGPVGKNAGSRPPQKTLHPPVQSGLKSVFVPARKRL